MGPSMWPEETKERGSREIEMGLVDKLLGYNLKVQPRIHLPLPTPETAPRASPLAIWEAFIQMAIFSQKPLPRLSLAH